MKTRWKILIAAGIFLLLAAASTWLTAHHQPQNAVEDYKKILRAQGEKLEISEVLPPLIAQESNGVKTVRSAFALFPSPNGDDWTNLPPAMWLIAPGKAIICSQQPDVRVNNFTNSWENVIANAEANKPVTEMLWQTMNFAAIDFQSDYDKGVDMMLPHLSPMKRCAQKLSAAAICNLHQGDAGLATTNLCAALRTSTGSPSA